MTEAYLDGNGTVPLLPGVSEAMAKWARAHNPSSLHGGAARKLLEDLKAAVARRCGVVEADPDSGGNPRAYRLILTSGGCEANSTAIGAILTAARRRGLAPHVVCALGEHASVQAALEDAQEDGVRVTWVAPGATGAVDPADIAAAVEARTALVVVMAANNETGAVNPLPAIAAVCARSRVPLFSDAVQAFGKSEFAPSEWGVAGFSVSLHKVGGPKGVGVLALREDLCEALGLRGIIHGEQQHGFRGGTENVQGAAGALVAVRHFFAERRKLFPAWARLRTQLLARLRALGPVRLYMETGRDAWTEHALAAANTPDLQFVVFTPLPAPNLLNTLLFAPVTPPQTRRGNPAPPVCGKALCLALAKKNVYVSVGSACGSARAGSRVLQDMSVPHLAQRGALRVSFTPETEARDVERFCNALAAALVPIVEAVRRA